MRNLRNTQRILTTLSDFGLPLTASAWDTSSDALICAFGPSKTEAVIELRRVKADDGCFEENYTHIASWDAPCPNPNLECDQILSLQYFSDIATACLVLSGGDIVLVREQPLSGEDSIEIVGSVDAGILGARWSPDEELLTLVTGANTVIFMTRNFEAPVNISLNSDDIKVSNHVSVGWGKAETQFKGKRAKALRDPTVPEKVDEGTLSALDDKKISISWRGDGAYVAINTIEAEQRRIIRVYSREGVLDSVSEPVDGLEGALSWRPSGNLISGIQRLPDRIDVVFFERNGLRHGQFSLRLSEEDRNSWGRNISLTWNSDSTVLAVAFQDRVQFWVMGNYHYYLKQEIKALSVLDSTVRVQWHAERPLHLTINTEKVTQIIEFVWNVARGPNGPPNDHGSVAVIDGTLLKLTPLRLANVPPPISLHELIVESNIRDVAFSSNGREIGVLCDNAFYLFQYLAKTKPPSPPTLQATVPLDTTENRIPRQLTLGNEGEAIILYDIANENPKASLLEFIRKATTHSTQHSSPDIKNLFSNFDAKKSFIHLSDNSVVEVTDGAFGVQPITRFPSEVSRVEVAHLQSGDVAFGITPKGSLFANERLLLRNCSSFLLTSTHLVITTSQHLLKFILLASENELEVPPDEPETDERCRSIERGGKLVTIMPTAYSVVLQMPRGNLETIFPRALVLEGIRRSIDTKDYRTSFMACRNQRVDMNILHDHDPSQFLANVSMFIYQLKDPGHLDLFLSQLRDEDVTETIYRKTSKAVSSKNQQSVISTGQMPKGALGKVNRICDAILKELSQQPETKMQNIITANVCKDPPALEAGLKVVGDLQAQDAETAERAAEHICFLADINQLYDHALGLYNLELALMIAQQSQKDPREYLPYMQSLQELPQLRRAFAIDDKLGRRSKALKHLHELDVFDEFRSYAQNHELYADALDLVKYQPDRLKEIMRVYADYLNASYKYKEAGTAYEYLLDYSSAASAYRAAHLWRESLTCALLVPYSAEALVSHASELAENLVELKDYASAGSIHRDFLSDVEGAAKLYCKAYQFDEAMKLLALQLRADLIPTIIDAGLVEASANMTELAAECKNQLNAQVPRLRELRQKKEQDPLAFFAGDPSAGADGGADIPDNISIAMTSASTTGTFMTRYTQRSGTVNTNATRKTSKKRRNEERKRAKGKKGSVYEEEYLVNSVGRLAERLSDVAGDVERLVRGLVRRGMRERADAVERAYVEVRSSCEEVLPEVFEVVKQEPKVDEEGETDANGERPLGADGVLWDAMQESKKRRDPPVLKKFERLSLV